MCFARNVNITIHIHVIHIHIRLSNQQVGTYIIYTSTQYCGVIIDYFTFHTPTTNYILISACIGLSTGQQL